MPEDVRAEAKEREQIQASPINADQWGEAVANKRPQLPKVLRGSIRNESIRSLMDRVDKDKAPDRSDGSSHEAHA